MTQLHGHMISRNLKIICIIITYRTVEMRAKVSEAATPLPMHLGAHISSCAHRSSPRSPPAATLVVHRPSSTVQRSAAHHEKGLPLHTPQEHDALFHGRLACCAHTADAVTHAAAFIGGRRVRMRRPLASV